ncbi:MAG: hypothetical protein ACRDK3_03310 [Actinomycetota bacterium]
MKTSILLAQSNSFGEFTREPILTVACVLLIVVSLAWIIVSRMIVRQLKRYDAALQPRRRRPSTRTKKVWEEPPA